MNEKSIKIIAEPDMNFENVMSNSKEMERENSGPGNMKIVEKIQWKAIKWRPEEQNQTNETSMKLTRNYVQTLVESTRDGIPWYTRRKRVRFKEVESWI